MDAITSFKGEHAFLSNFHAVPFWLDGVEYPTVEHFYQAGKAMREKERAWVLGATSPGEAKKRGRTLQVINPNWDRLKLAVMRRGVLAKFNQNTPIAMNLLETGGTPLIEVNDWGDEFWGMVLRDGALHGHNNLGKTLEWVRNTILRERMV